MRKSTIWLFASVMVFAFAVLLYLQFNYVHEILTIRKSEFNESVKRVLYQVSRNLELDETSQYMQRQYMQSELMNPEAVIYNSSTTIGHRIIKNDSLPLQYQTEVIAIMSQINRMQQPKVTIAPSQGKGSIADKSREIQGAMQDRYNYYKGLVDEIVVHSLTNAHLRPIEERVDFKKIDVYLKSELLNNGLTLPYKFAVVDKNKNTVYKSPQFDEGETVNLFTQILFPKDPPSRLYTLQVYFPTEKEYLFSSVQFIITSVGFTMILLFIFILTMYIVSRQKRLSEMKNDFINNMTHELKTPVSTISLASQMLKDSELSKSPQMFNHISGVIQDETKRLGFLVEKVLQMSLFETRKTSLKMKEMDVNDVLANVAHTFTLRVEKCGGKLDVELNAMDSTIFVDELHFTNVLFNLMENAVKYRREEVPLILIARTWNEGDKVMVSIQDNGMGIKKENLKKIFDRFYRVHTGNRHDVKGFGLGLAYVKKIIDDLNGTIKVESELNVGTKFIITLPYIKQ